MKELVLKAVVACILIAPGYGVMAATGAFSFAIIDHPFRESPDDALLRKTIAETDADNLAFVVVNGIKAASEPCSDNVYNGRKALLAEAQNGLIVSLAASDWTDCKGKNGKSTAIGRLNRLRELFFIDDMSMGATRIPLVRQSTAVKFRSYSENARWEVGKAMFATMHLPANNNHYLHEAGRNSEFEDRLIANRNWLNRVFTHAKLAGLNGIVIFCDGNPFGKPARRRDGFAEVRRQITALAANHPGKVLLVHGRSAAASKSAGNITWRNNIGILESGSPWMEIRFDPSAPALFAVRQDPAQEAKRLRVANAPGVVPAPAPISE